MVGVMSGIKRRLAVTEAQAEYLTELIEDDLEGTTDLTSNERDQAKSLLKKLRALNFDFEINWEGS